MSTNTQEEKISPTNNDNSNNDDELDRLARQMLVEEAKRNKVRAEIQGTSGWQKPKFVTNRKFLQNTLISNAVHNIYKNKNEQEKQQHMKSKISRKQDNYYHRRKRSRTSPQLSSSSSSSSSSRTKHNDNDNELSSKRLKKDKP